MDRIIRYFDLLSEVKARRRAVGYSNSAKALHWLPQWVSLILGIIIQPFFVSFQETGIWDFGNLPSWTLFSLIMGFMIFPGVYKNAFDEEKPLIVQLGPIFTAGLGWQTLLGAAIKAGAPVVGIK